MQKIGLRFCMRYEGVIRPDKTVLQYRDDLNTGQLVSASYCIQKQFYLKSFRSRLGASRRLRSTSRDAAMSRDAAISRDADVSRDGVFSRCCDASRGGASTSLSAEIFLLFSGNDSATSSSKGGA